MAVPKRKVSPSRRNMRRAHDALGAKWMPAGVWQRPEYYQAAGQDRLACIEAGMDDHIGKPVGAESFYATLLRWMPRNARQRDPQA